MTTVQKIIYNKIGDLYHLWEEFPNGCSGAYIQVSKDIGVKIYGYPERQISDLTHHIEWAETEHKRLKRTKIAYKYVPKSYGVKIFNTKSGYRVGLVMQHVGDTTLKDLRRKRVPYLNKKVFLDKTADIIINKLRRKIRHKGQSHNDLHAKNVIYDKGKFWVIDWESSCVQPQIKNRFI